MPKNKPSPKPSPKSTKDDNKAYLAVSIVFLTVGLVSMFTDSLRVTGIPFVVLGLTFFILSQDKSKTKPKK